MSTKKYLDQNGLSHFWGKVKSKIPTKTSNLTNDSGFVTNEVTVSTTQPTDNSEIWIDPSNVVNGIRGENMKYKYNGQWIDVNIKALDSMAIGCIIQFIGTTIPTGWLECDGSTITQANYPELYDLIGETLPDFRGRVLVGQKTSDSDFDTLGETGGVKTHKHTTGGHTLTFAELPTRAMIQGYFSGSYTITGSACTSVNGPNWVETNNYDCTDLSGGYGQAHSHGDTGSTTSLQPYGVVKHIIKAKNTVPTMASIVDAYSTSTNDGYSCNYVNNFQPVVLYSNNNGTTSDFILQDSVTNYKKIEVGYITNDSNQGVKTIYNNGDSTFYTEIFEIWTSSNTGNVIYIKNAQLMFNGTNVLVGNGYETYLTSGTFSRSSSNNISIKYVIGYK